MKLLTEYLQQAVRFEQLVADEPNPEFKAQLLEQAHAYRKLAEKRAEQYGLPPPTCKDG